MPKSLIFDAFTLLIREKNVTNYAFLRCKTFSLKIWLCKILDKYHVCLDASRRIMRPHQNICCLFQTRVNDFSSQSKYTHTQSYFQFVACALVWKLMVFTKGLEARNIFSNFPFFEAFDLKDQRNQFVDWVHLELSPATCNSGCCYYKTRFDNEEL